MPLSVGLGFERQPRLAPWIVEGHAQYSVPHLRVRDVFAVEESLCAARPVMHSHRHLVPPGLESALARIKVDVDSAIGSHTAHALPKINLPRIGHAVPIVGIDRAVAVIARVDIQGQRSLRYLRGTLYQRLARQYGPGADEHR